jgi:glycerol-3-phosphate O-acyltransferase
LSFIGLSILAHKRDLMPVSQILEDYQFFKRLFRHEFIFDDRLDNPQEVSEILAYLNQREMVSIKEKTEKKWIEITGSGRVHLGHFAGLIHNYIESCWIVVRGTTYLRHKARPEKEFMKKLLHFGNKLYRKGEIKRAESLSQANYTNALRYLRDEGIVNCGEIFVKGERSKIPLYTLGEVKDLENLRRRLFRFL